MQLEVDIQEITSAPPDRWVGLFLRSTPTGWQIYDTDIGEDDYYSPGEVSGDGPRPGLSILLFSDDAPVCYSKPSIERWLEDHRDVLATVRGGMDQRKEDGRHQYDLTDDAAAAWAVIQKFARNYDGEFLDHDREAINFAVYLKKTVTTTEDLRNVIGKPLPALYWRYTALDGTFVFPEDDETILRLVEEHHAALSAQKLRPLRRDKKRGKRPRTGK